MLTITESWLSLKKGNLNFVSSNPSNPHRTQARRSQLVVSQKPHSVVFGCSDSRTSHEIIFDQGLGDIFVVRTAGHTLDTAVLGSLEYGVEILGAALIVVTGHSSCGAIDATLDTVRSGTIPHGYIREIVEKVSPSVVEARAAGITEIDAMEAWHTKATAKRLYERSVIINKKIDAGELGLIGLVYDLTTGKIDIQVAIGPIEDPDLDPYRFP